MKRLGLLLTFLSVLLTGCIGGGSKKTSDPDCASGQTFDTVSRSCQGAVVVDQPPIPTLTSFSLLEDSGTTAVTLTYSDPNGDQAFSCSVTSLSTDLYTILPICSCTAGVCSIDITPDANFNGSGDFFYTVTDSDGTSNSQYVSVTISSVNDSPVVSNVTLTMDEDETAFTNIDLTTVAVIAGTSAVTTAGSFDDSQGGAPSENNTPLEYTVITGASKGTASINSSSGLFTYTPNANDEISGGDSVIVGVRDSIMTANNESYVPVTITINQGTLDEDSPVAENTVISGSFTEDTAFTFNAANGQLKGTEYDSADFANTYVCSINANTSNIFQTGACTCTITAGDISCDVPVLPKQNVDGATVFEYRIEDQTDVLNSTYKTENITIASTDDSPWAFATIDGCNFDTASCDGANDCTDVATATTGDPSGSVTAAVNVIYSDSANGNCYINTDGATAWDRYDGQVQLVEPAGPAPSGTETFTLEAPWDEVASTVTFSVVSTTSSGTLSCTEVSDKYQCNYTTTSGNLQDTTTPTFANNTNAAAEMRFVAVTKGTDGNNISVEMIDVPNLGSDPQVIVSSSATNIQIYVEETVTTVSQVLEAVEQHPIAKNIISVENIIPGAINAFASPETINLAGAVGVYADAFTYRATDAGGNATDRTVYISLTGTNDKPVMCNYSNYSDLNACGGLGCIGTNDPSGSITPSTHTASKPIVYFNSADGVCWISTGSAANTDWQIVDNSTDPSHIQNITVNEGEGTIVLDNFGVDEGGSGGEDADTLSVTSITSDNTILIPSGNISVYFDDVNYAVSASFGGVTSEGDGDFRLEIVPQVGNVGTANISMTLQDSSGETSTFTFAVTVQAFSAIHNGWKNITAVGPKFDKFDQLKDTNKSVCSYNLDKCNSGQECTKATLGPNDPNGTITADEANVLYHDGDNNNCYVATAAGTTWTALSTNCAVTPTNLNSNCTGAACIGSAAPTINATDLNQFFFDSTNTVCYRSIATGGGAADWEVYQATAEVTIEWENFDPVPNTESITEYEIYRRLANEQFDYTQKLNRSTIDDAITTYVDNAVNSTTPPIPGTVYYYEVRPVIQGVSTNTDEVFKTLRVTAPPNNMVFAHRWMVNKSMCELMNSTSIDPNNDYRCLYEGPGDSGTTPGSNYYDIGSDLLVDRNEAGCDYGDAPACIGTSDGACVGIDDPTTAAITTTGGLDGVIYYARSNGLCYVSGGGGTTWTQVTGATIITDYLKAHLPPLVNITQSEAHNFCASEQTGTILGISMGDSATSANCDYTRDLCSTGDCTGGADPNGVVTGPFGALFLDSTNNNCFYNVNGGNEWAMTGCNVSLGACSGVGDCVGAGAPGGIETAKNGSIYWDTTGDTCYENTSTGTGNTWTAIAATSMALAKVLPTRKQQMAYSLWDTENNTDSQITTIETGLSLNSSAKCNSSQANGLSANYSDVNVPDSNTFYTLPGTATSNIRSMITGSDETNTCVSRFGVQDHVGNVAEWTVERFNCRSTCPFSLNACDTSDSQCTDATAAPSQSVTANVGTYYHEQDSNICWINTNGSTGWKPSHCPYSDSDCNGGSACTDATQNPNAATVAAAEGTIYYEADADVCWRNTDGTTTGWSSVGEPVIADLDFGASYCTTRINGQTDALAATRDDMRYGDGSDQWFNQYILDGAVGPCVDSDSDDACDSNIDSWALEDERNSAGRYVIPMGLPVVTDFNTNFPASDILSYLFEIGPTSGITSTQMRDDIVVFDSATIAGETTGCGGMAVGGSYLDGSGAGVYNLELLPCTDTARSRITVGDVTVVQRAAVLPNLEFFNPGAAQDDEVVSANAGTGQIIVNLRHDGTNVVSTPASIVRAINNDATASSIAYAFISGDASSQQSASSQTNFTSTEKSNAMVDVGFRCVVPVTGYEE